MELSKSLMKWPILSMLEPEFISNIDMVVVYGDSDREALIVTHDRMVYALGRNKDGCAGMGDSQCSLNPTKVDICEKNIKKIAHGSSPHVLALTEDGKVYSWGNNSQYQLGNKSDNTNSSATPTFVQENLSDKFVVDIACGNFHSLALTGDGEVYEWRENNHTLTDSTYIMIPRKVQSTFGGKRVVCISCGGSFSMAVTADGEVYGWGNNEYGQLGIGNYNNETQPCKITGLTGIVIAKVVCGSNHTLALSNKGILYTWGGNCWGQLGSSIDTNVSSPVQLEMPLVERALYCRILDIAASHYNHISVAVEEDNRVLVWGKCLEQSIKIPTRSQRRCLYDALAYFTRPIVMHKPFLLHVNGTTNLTDCLEEAFDDPTTSDLTIQVEGTPIHVHKAILKIRCRYFRTMFQKHSEENNRKCVIKHEEFSYDVYRAFLEYLYTDKINVPIEDALEFLDLTNAYCESQLRSRWIQLIKKDVTVKYAIPLYNAAIQYNAKELEEYCFQFAVNHMTAVVRRSSFSKLDELTKKSFIIKAVNAPAYKTLVAPYQSFKTTTHNLMNWAIFESLEPKFISNIRMVFVYYEGEVALIVTKDGILYGLGNNDCGCLGTGDTSSTLSPTKVKALSGKGIKTFAHATNQISALTEKGEVYSWGWPYGSTNEYKPTSQDLTPTLVEGYPSEKFVVDIACGHFHSLALTNDGEVYAWGMNTYGQVDSSSPSKENVCRKAGVILPGKKIVYIRCCNESSMAVTDVGEVYSWGRNINGELGRGDFNEAVGVHKVQIPTQVVIEKIACGRSHTLALSNEGVLYVWGANTAGQLGLGHKDNACTPVKLQVGEMGRVLDVAASPFYNISFAVSEHNWVFAWGTSGSLRVVIPTCTPFECFHDAFAHYLSYRSMHQPLIVSSEKEMSITNNLRHAFDDVATSDLTINVGGQPIYVHKAILRIRSPYFRGLFREHCAENNQSVMKHEQFCYDIYKAYLEYLYTDEINIPAENSHELLDLAVTYSDSVLRNRCIPLSESGMKIENVASIYSICVKHDLKELEQVCLKFVVNNLTAVVQTPDFFKLDALMTQSLVIEAAKAGAFKK